MLRRFTPPALLSFVVIGCFLAWSGGFLLSSSNSRCTDGPNGRTCSGAFAGEGWHWAGVAVLVGGLAPVALGVCGVGLRAARRRGQPGN